MKGVDVIAKVLETEGVEYLACFPHSEIIDSCAALGIRPLERPRRSRRCW